MQVFPLPVRGSPAQLSAAVAAEMSGMKDKERRMPRQEHVE